MTFRVLSPPISSRNQQLLDDLAVAICDTDVQRRMPVQILLIDPYLFLGQQILDDLFAATVASPMQRRAPLEIHRVYIELSLVQVENGVDLIALGGKVQQVHAQITRNGQIRLVLQQRLEHGDVALEGRVVGSSQSLGILLIEQQLGPTLDLIESIPLILQVPSIVLDIELNMAVLVEIGTVMDRRVFLAVADEQEVQGSLLVLEEELDVFELLGGEEELLLVFVFRHIL